MAQDHPGANHGAAYGALDNELKVKISSKLDPKLEAEAKEYVTQWTGTPINDIHKDLLSGVVLCNMINNIAAKYSPGAPVPCRTISKLNQPFKMQENIGNFLSAAQNKLGLKSTDCFMAVDLYEAKNLVPVVDCLLHLKRKYPYKA